MKSRPSYCDKVTQCLSTSAKYTFTALKSAFFINVSLGSLAGMSSRSFFGGEQLAGLPVGIPLALGTFGIVAATRVPAIYKNIYGKEKNQKKTKPVDRNDLITPALKNSKLVSDRTTTELDPNKDSSKAKLLNNDLLIAQQPDAKADKIQPSNTRIFCANAAAYAFKGISIFQMGISSTSSFLALKKAFSYVIPESWPKAIPDVLIVDLVLALCVQYWTFNLKLNGFKNSDKLKECIMTANYFDKRAAFYTFLASLLNVSSSPFVAYFSTVEGIPQIPGLKNVLYGDNLHYYGIVASILGMSSNFVMTLPSVYYLLKDGAAVKLPETKSTCLQQASCGLVENPWVVLKNAFVYPFGILDNLGSGAFTYRGVSYTLPKLFNSLTPGSKVVVALSALSGVSSFVTSYAFATRGGIIKLLPDSFKDSLKAERNKVKSKQKDSAPLASIHIDNIDEDTSPSELAESVSPVKSPKYTHVNPGLAEPFLQSEVIKSSSSPSLTTVVVEDVQAPKKNEASLKDNQAATLFGAGAKSLKNKTAAANEELAGDYTQIPSEPVVDSKRNKCVIL